MSQEQQHDHIWLTIRGEGWAIERLDGDRLHLWRGYASHLERLVVDWPRKDWLAYAEQAATSVMRWPDPLTLGISDTPSAVPPELRRIMHDNWQAMQADRAQRKGARRGAD
jgi:hypothetical protein